MYVLSTYQLRPTLHLRRQRRFSGSAGVNLTSQSSAGHRVAIHRAALPAQLAGFEGSGETGAIDSPPAMMNAIVGALTPVGVAHVDMPAIPKWLSKWFARARSA